MPTLVSVKEALTGAPEFLASLGVTVDDVAAIVDPLLRQKRTLADAFSDQEWAAKVAPTRMKIVGEGHYAIAFSLPSGKVLKVTVDRDDAQAAELVKRAGAKGAQPVGLPRVEEVKRLPSHRWPGFFAIVVEPVDPFLFKEGSDVGLKEFLGAMSRMKLWSIRDLRVHGRQCRVPGIFGVPGMVERFDVAMHGVKWLHEHGFDVEDLHIGNFGETRDGRPVMFDFGDDSRTREKEVRIRVAKNPKIVGFGPSGAIEAAAGLAMNGRRPSKAETQQIWLDLGSPDVDMDELLTGIEVEQEHTGDLREAGKIALDHLREFSDYYTRLTKMEARAKAGLPANPRVHAESREAAFKRLGAENNRFAAALKKIDSKYGLGDVFNEYARAKSAEEFMAVQRSHTARVAKISPEDAERREQIMRQWEDMLSEKIGLMTERDRPDITENPPAAKRLSDTEWFVSLTPAQLAHADDLGWFSEFEDDDGNPLVTPVAGSRGSSGIRGTQESLLKFAEFYEQDGESGGKDYSSRVAREAAKRIRLAFGLDPDRVAAEVRARFYARMARLNRGEPVEENPSRSMPKVRAAFDECFDIVEEQFPDVGTIELHEDERAGGDNGHGSERQFGYCKDGKNIVIAFASKTEKLPVANIRGLMAHEFGHALDYRYGDKLGKMLGQRLPEGVERRADAIAQAVFGKTIRYDAKDVQCVACQGTSPRPRRLGA